MIEIIQSLSEEGICANEDLIWYNESCVMLLDGATSLVPSTFTARDFARRFCGHFAENIRKCGRLSSAINESVCELRSEFLSENKDESQLYPSAAGVFGFVLDDTLYLANLGDCAALVFFKNGSVQTIYDTSVEKLDSLVIERMIQIRSDTGADICEIVKLPEIRAMLISNRNKMNSPDGYRVLSINTEPLSESDLLSLKTDEVEMVVFYSDGFAPVVDAIREIPNCDFNMLYRRLRDTEQSDAKMNEKPRFKISDDASAISFRFT